MARCSAALILLCALPAAAERLFLGEVPVEAERGVTLLGPMRVRFSLRPGSGGRLDLLESRAQVLHEEGGAAVRLDGYPIGRDAVLAQYSRPSFLVDYDETPVQTLREVVRREAGDHPRPEQLEAFVARYIDKKSYRRGQDPASVVARLREGDCKAHAVLLGALARMFGVPARLVVGLALVSAEGRVRAFGHAWVEVHDEVGWRAADAITLPKADSVLRLPLSVVSDEGPAYILSLAEATTGLQDVRAIRILRAE
jgi:transglutaminase-like putative cysteine protease